MATTGSSSKRHVSRWRLCTPSPLPGQAPTTAAVPPVSLRYLNEFVGKLHCAPALLQHGLFPDAKEITESMALFNAVRRYLAPQDSEQEGDATENTAGNGNSTAVGSTTDTKPDGIVVVGDGNTPRTAAMFAFRMRGWKCYSVDPAMEKNSTERSKGWADVANLVVVRNKIENVRIALRRAIVVLVHAHVTLEQALGAIQAENICGVVTLPCCNWYSRQELLFTRGPDLVYDDFSVLSDHREIRLWVGSQKTGDGSGVNTAHADLSLASSVMKGCVRKELVAGALTGSSNASGASSILKKRRDGALAFLHDVLEEQARAAEEEGESEQEEATGSSLPTAVATHLPPDTHVLVLDWRARRQAVRALLSDGYTNIYTLSLLAGSNSAWTSDGEKQTERLRLQLSKCRLSVETGSSGAQSDEEEETLILEPCGLITIESSVIPSDSNADATDEDDLSEQICVVIDQDGGQLPGIECVLDSGFIFRGFRGRAKKNPAFFRRLYATLDRVVAACSSSSVSSVLAGARVASLICLTPRKQWRRKEFLAHSELGYDVQALIGVSQHAPAKPVYVYCCHKREMRSVPGVETSVVCSELGDQRQIVKDSALETKQALQAQLDTRQHELGQKLQCITSHAALVAVAHVEQEEKTTSQKTYVRVTGEIMRVRRFSNGMAFLSLAPGGEGAEVNPSMQVFLQHEELRWSPETFKEVVALLRKGDELVAVGCVGRNARGHAIVKVEALALGHNSEFEAYN